MLMTGNAWADGEPPTENILKDQFKKQYHGILKLDAITLKNLDAKGNQATWSAEGDVSSSDDLYTWVGQLADYELLEQTWTKDKPVKFSAMLTSKGTPASGWSVNFYSFQAAASDRGRVVDDIKKLSSQPAMPVKCVSWRRCLATSVLISWPKQTSA